MNNENSLNKNNFRKVTKYIGQSSVVLVVF